MNLNQEVEQVKDKFHAIEQVMARLELNTSIDKAAQFLNEYSNIAYYSIVSCLGQVIDKLMKDGSG